MFIRPSEPKGPSNAETPCSGGFGSTATGIRTRVSAVRGRRPSPLDDSGGGGVLTAFGAFECLSSVGRRTARQG